MKIAINRESTIDSVKSDFSGIYPFLKIEFFKKPHVTGTGSMKRFMYEGENTINNISRNDSEGKIPVDKETTVAQLEKYFEREYGLHVQVF